MKVSSAEGKLHRYRFHSNSLYDKIQLIMRRVFIAINLPEEIKKKLAFYQSKWPELPIRWTKKDNLHITLIFIGNTSDEELLKICKIVKEAVSKNQSFQINLDRICYGPSTELPRMVWVRGEKSREFTLLRDNLERALMGSKKTHFSPESRAFLPHITLGRIRQWDFKKIEPEERPVIDQEINLSFQVNSVEVMESQLKRRGAEYIVLESVALLNA